MFRWAGALVEAQEGASGTSGDGANEIHPDRGGYDKLAAVWRRARRDWGLGF